jgi:hypothetical protein
MAYTNDQQLELLTSGQADWDTSINANMLILERGQHIVMSAGSAINSGQVLTVTSGAWALPLDARSIPNVPQLISYRSVSSGDTAQFLALGTVRSMSVWSGNIAPGELVYVSASSPGFCVKSFSGHGFPIGLALANDAVLFNPGAFPVFPELVTEVRTVGPITVGANGDFVIPIGNRGTVRDLTVVTSHNRYKVRFWSGSARVSSELLYETLTRSLAINTGDVNTPFFRDAAMFSYRGTDANTPWAIFGRINPQSATSVVSAYAVVTVVAERFR